MTIGRIVSVLAGAVVLFELEHGFGIKLYIAIPVAILVYFAIRFAFDRLWDAGDKVT
ncbi:MAG: hypothetical protein ACREB8_12625 [Pseudolabrys sp.]